MARNAIRVGFVGAGYIAAWHADALAAVPDAELIAVCDPATAAAAVLAGPRGAATFATLGAMLAEARCDAVHVLAPPHLHKDLALECLAAGAHVLVEKPFALTRSDAAAMLAAADAAGRVIAVNHNFLGLPAYLRLKRAIAAGELGRIDSAEIHWRYPLTPLRSGPFGLWMLRAPENLLLELGPHLYAFAVDLFGPLEDIELRLGRPIDIPGGVSHHQSWRVAARAGGVELALSLSLVEGLDDRSLALRGVCGAARLDFANDTLVIRRANAADLVLNPLRAELAEASQHLREGVRNAARQLGSLNRNSPYALGFQATIAAFYRGVREGGGVDRRFAGPAALAVTAAIERTLALRLPAPLRRPSRAPGLGGPPRPSVLVTGGTGFIGRALTHALVAAGRDVRVLSRGRQNPFADLGPRVEMVAGAPKDAAVLREALTGIEAVVHLARAEEASWDGYLVNDVAVTEALAEAALTAGIRRFVYTGTIASYDASRRDRPITEQTDFAHLDRRNLYARAKALGEARLAELQHARGLPLVLARPGIVVGPGGPLQHWGIGRWHGPGAVRLWGNGRNVLPFVLVDDVADALVLILAAADADVIGRSFNLVGEPLMSARDYFAAIHARTNTRIEVASGALTGFWIADLAKHLVKRHIFGRRGVAMPSLVDWRSRAHLAPFRNDLAKQVLGWRPEADRERFADRALGHPTLFGF